MSRVYNNWERLVEATLDRERLRELALCESFSSSIASDFSSSVASSFSSSTVSSFIFDSVVKPILAKPIHLSDLVIKAADEAASFERECSELKSKTKELAGLLRHAARTRNELYERPTHRIIDETNQVLDKALSLIHKCRSNGIMKRLFTTIPPASAFRKMSDQLENSIRNVSWLLCVSTSGEDPGLPPILVNEPILALTWEHIAILYSSPSIDERSSEAAAALVSLARDNDQYRKLIVEEGGVGPLLKLVKEGKLEGQENAARAIGLLGKDPESVEHMINAGVYSVFAKVLREGPVKVQAVVDWAISELAAHHPKCQDIFDACVLRSGGSCRRVIVGWDKGELLGRGRFGSVYEGIADDGTFFAVKEVSLLAQGEDGRQSIIELEQKIALLSQFEHENIVQYYGTKKDESHLYIFLELGTMGSLLSLYQKYCLHDRQVSAYTGQILHGLKYLHERDVIHRDIRCANILVDINGLVKLADFGLTRASKLNDVKSCRGTAYWLAPEVVRRQGYGLLADIWSLGCTVLEMLTRSIPYSNLESMHALYRIGKGEGPTIPDTLSSDARDFILKCLQVDPSLRPTAAQLLDHPFVKQPLPSSWSAGSPHNFGRQRT